MKIVVMNREDFRIEVLNLPANMVGDGKDNRIEQFLVEHGYSLKDIKWMAARLDLVKVTYHEFGIDGNGNDTHTMRQSRMKNFSIYQCVQEVKHREQDELVAALHQHGQCVDNGYEWHFESDQPIVAAYLYDEPCDVVVMAVRVDEDGVITLIVEDKNDRGIEHEIAARSVFAGHLEYVTLDIR